MANLIRDLRLFADGTEIAQGCHMTLTARDTLTLRPALHHLSLLDLSDSSSFLLSGCRQVELRSGASILAFGEVVETLTRSVAGKRRTDLVFSPGLSLWQASISLSVTSGMTVSETMRAILSRAVYPIGEKTSSARSASYSGDVIRKASTFSKKASLTGFSSSFSSVPGFSLSSFAAEDRTLPRPQSFFGRACDALTLLAETADADAFLSSAGVAVSGRAFRAPTVIISEEELLTEPLQAGNRILLSSNLLSWPLGSFLQYTWRGTTVSGRLVSRLLQADNRDGPWKCELELEI